MLKTNNEQAVIRGVVVFGEQIFAEESLFVFPKNPDTQVSCWRAVEPPLGGLCAQCIGVRAGMKSRWGRQLTVQQCTVRGLSALCVGHLPPFLPAVRERQLTLHVYFASPLHCAHASSRLPRAPSPAAPAVGAPAAAQGRGGGAHDQGGRVGGCLEKRLVAGEMG